MAQEPPPSVICILPDKLDEVSGIEMKPDTNTIWVVNDSGNAAVIYSIDTSCSIGREIEIDKKNRDWEDLTLDSNGNLYIGDFGNNGNRRDNLRIIKIHESEFQSETPDVEVIKFRYEDQKAFPPSKSKRFFDCEAFFYMDGHLYLLTKSAVKQAYGETRLYKLPAEKGSYVAEKIGAFTTCDNSNCRVTSADLSPDGKTLAVLTYDELLLFSNFSGEQFLEGALRRIPLGYPTQKEGVCFSDNETVIVVDEDNRHNGGWIHRFNIVTDTD